MLFLPDLDNGAKDSSHFRVQVYGSGTLSLQQRRTNIGNLTCTATEARTKICASACCFEAVNDLDNGYLTSGRERERS